MTGAGPSGSLCSHPSSLASWMFPLLSLSIPVFPTPLIPNLQPLVLSCSVSPRPVFISRCICVCERSLKACSKRQKLVMTSVSILLSGHLILCLCIHSNTLVSTNSLQLAVGYTMLTQTWFLTFNTFKFNLTKQKHK